MRYLFPLLALGLSSACGSDQLSSDEEAELAYLGLDLALQKSMDLGFDGFNAADSANIDLQQTTGDVSGTLSIGGQVDQGSSDNKGMRLDVDMVEYSDFVDLDDDDEAEISVTYWTDTDAGLPAFDLQLKGIPDGTLDGTLAGTFGMRGDIEGDVTLSVTISGQLESDGAAGTRRVEGSTTVVGTATSSSGGTYDIDITI